MQMHKQISTADLFCGGGGWTTGLQQCGMAAKQKSFARSVMRSRSTPPGLSSRA
jgi:site-specific DNA-cytosine methylase